MTLKFGYTTIDVPNSQYTYAEGINDFGQVAGFGAGQPFLASDGNIQILSTSFLPSSVGSVAPSGINNLGEIVGAFEADGFGIIAGQTEPLGPVSDPLPGRASPGGLNDFGTIVGRNFDTGTGSDTVGWIDEGGKFTTIAVPGRSVTDPAAINDFGTIVGFTANDGGSTLGFLDEAGKFSTFQVPGALYTNPAGINNWGEIVGNATPATGPSVGFVDFAGHMETFRMPGASTFVVSGVNDFGQISGWYSTPGSSGVHGFVGTPDFSSLLPKDRFS